MKTREFFVTMRDGQVVNRNTLKEQIVSLPDGRYIFKIEDKSVRTSQQNRYMHLMFSMIQKGFYDIGYREVRNTEDAKYIMKEMFLKYTVDNGTGGKIQMVRRTRDLTKEMMAEFIDECIQFSAQNLNVVIPSPNEQIEIWQPINQ
jgi:thioredoxin-related protein